jgi:hypothetical protein
MLASIYLKTQSKAFFSSLRFSFGISTTKSAQAQALKLAPTVKIVKPGIFSVGKSTCDLWHMSCTCQSARQRKAKGISQINHPCPHFIALYLAQEWHPYPTEDPVAHLKAAGIEQPAIIAIYARVKHLSKWITVRLENSSIKDAYLAYTLNDADFFLVWPKLETIRNITPFYE